MLRKLGLFFIRIYWWTLSPIIGSVCRFQPSCSRYTAVCIDRYGMVRGGFMGFVRICKCQPFHPGGYDPPPRRPGEDPGYEAPRTPRIVLPGLADAVGPSRDAAEKHGGDVHSGPVSSNLAPASPGPESGASR